ncbi:MAG TPA: PH domain-containing protein [Acidimicrobiales bacterium]|nr:PH domain-containing protein [Acidimicrobiales bacterium]
MAESDPGRWTAVDPRAVVLWRIIALTVSAAAVAAAAMGAWLAHRADLVGSTVAVVGPVSLAVAAIAGSLAGPVLAHRRWRYRLGELAIELRRGVIVHRTSAVPYVRVQQIDLAQGPVERILGLSRAVVTTAAATTDGSIPGLRTEVAEHLRALVLERVGDDDAV